MCQEYWVHEELKKGEEREGEVKRWLWKDSF